MVTIYSEKKESHEVTTLHSVARSDRFNSNEADVFATFKKTIQEEIKNDLTFVKAIKWK